MRSWIGRLSRPFLRLGSPAIRAGIRSLDVGPFPMDWTDVTSETLNAETDKLQVTSINTPVRFTAASPAGMTVVAYVNGNTSTTGATSTTLGVGATAFVVFPNSYVWFAASSFLPTTGTVTVRNSSANNALVDSVTIELGVSPPP